MPPGAVAIRSRWSGRWLIFHVAPSLKLGLELRVVFGALEVDVLGGQIPTVGPDDGLPFRQRNSTRTLTLLPLLQTLMAFHLGQAGTMLQHGTQCLCCAYRCNQGVGDELVQ